jgi:hypothetical protein
MADKTPQTIPTQAPRQPRPPEHFPVIAPPDFALPEKRVGLFGGKLVGLLRRKK